MKEECSTDETNASGAEPAECAQGAESAAGVAAACGEADDLSGLLQKLDEMTAEANAQRDRYLRTVADMENYRKRALREKDDVRRYANCALVEELLPVLDNFSMGLQAAEQHESGKAFADGFAMVLSQLRGVLKDNGVEELNPVHADFDPNFHESLGMRPHGEVAEGQVIEVQRIGYRLHDRLLRPAAVIVSSGAGDADAQAAEGDA